MFNLILITMFKMYCSIRLWKYKSVFYWLYFGHNLKTSGIPFMFSYCPNGFSIRFLVFFVSFTRYSRY